MPCKGTCVKWGLPWPIECGITAVPLRGLKKKDRRTASGAHLVTNSYAHSHESPLVIRLEEVLSESAGHSYTHRKGRDEGQRAEGDTY